MLYVVSYASEIKGQTPSTTFQPVPLQHLLVDTDKAINCHFEHIVPSCV